MSDFEIKDKIKDKKYNKKLIVLFEKSIILCTFLTNIIYIILNNTNTVDNKMVSTIIGSINATLILIDDFTKYFISNINDDIEELNEEKLKLEFLDKKFKSLRYFKKNQKKYWIPFFNN
jgi:hypothetical protein